MSPASSQVVQPKEAGIWWTRNRIVGATGLLVGLAVAAHALSLSTGSWKAPGPGMWPLVVGVILGAASLATMVPRVETTQEEHFTAGSRAVFPALLSLVVFIWAFNIIGFSITGFALALFWLKFLGRGAWLPSIIMAAVGTLIFQLLFVGVLGVLFPDDLLYSWRQ